MRFLSRFGIATLVGFLASSLIALASYSLGLSSIGRFASRTRAVHAKKNMQEISDSGD